MSENTAISQEQREKLNDGINQNPTANPPVPRLTLEQRNHIRALLTTGQEKEAWNEYCFLANSAMYNAMERIKSKADFLVSKDDRRFPGSNAQGKQPVRPQGDMSQQMDQVMSKGATSRPNVKQAGWTLKKPARMQGYGQVLHQVLKVAHDAKRELPTTRDVLDAIRKRGFSGIEVMADWLKYETSDGTKTADVNALRKAIRRMTAD